MRPPPIGGIGGGPPLNGRPGGLFGRLCNTISSCVYFLCCCWLLRDCFGGPPGPLEGPPFPPPAPVGPPPLPYPPEPTLPGPYEPPGSQLDPPGPPGPPGGPPQF